MVVLEGQTVTPLFLEGTCHPNKSAIQFYVPSDVASDDAFPFFPRDEYRGMTVDGTDAVILWPKGEQPVFPLAIDDCPDELVPWPLEESRPAPNSD
ncbi:hypothetical protein [Halomontanus rarus]|uniref:hypothetical protein n=1 Tax=Halomontanus rarus TaxID=3034020 RepID=UPI0023E8B3EB|nr:hypothetical protein [Halovivax sp. TS33]